MTGPDVDIMGTEEDMAKVEAEVIAGTWPAGTTDTVGIIPAAAVVMATGPEGMEVMTIGADVIAMVGTGTGAIVIVMGAVARLMEDETSSMAG